MNFDKFGLLFLAAASLTGLASVFIIAVSFLYF